MTLNIIKFLVNIKTEKINLFNTNLIIEYKILYELYYCFYEEQ